MAQRLKIVVLLAVASLVLAVLLVGGRATTPTLARAQYPVSPVSVNGQDAGSLPKIVLTVAAIPNCDGGSFVPADGGGSKCGPAGTSLTAAPPLYIDAGVIDLHGAPVTTLTPDGGLVSCNGTACVANAITYTPGTGVVTFPSTATAPGLAQASTSGATGANLIDAPQASTNANGTPGSRVVRLAAATGSGTEAAFIVERATQPFAYLGPWALNTGFSALTMGVNVTPSGSSIANANYTILVSSAGGVTFGSQQSFDWYADGSRVATLSGANGLASFAFNVEVGGLGAATFGGGTDTIGINNGSPPTSACTGGTCVDSVPNVGLVATSAVFDVDILQPVTAIVGTDYSAKKFGAGPRCEFTVGGATSSSGSCTLTYPTRQTTYGSTVQFNVHATAKCVLATGGAPCVVGTTSTSPDSFTSYSIGLGGKLSPNGTAGTFTTPDTPSAFKSSDTNTATASCATVLGVNAVTLTCSNNVTQTGTFMWVIEMLDMSVN